jgi:tetratricopeptide (TPR) repeat protein
MRKILFTILFSFCCISISNSQNVHQIKSFADEQFALANYKLALKEYQRVLFFDDDRQYNSLYSRIGSIFYQDSDFDSALRYFDYALRVENDDSCKFELLLKKALCNFKSGRFLDGLNELMDLPDTQSQYLTHKRNLYFGICYYGIDDYENSRIHFSTLVDSAGKAEIDGLFNEIINFNKKFRPEKAELMSMLLPGLGQVYTGEILSGLNSFFLLAGITAYSLFTALNYNLIDGLLVLTSWFYRYYTGGYTNAHEFAGRRITDEKRAVYSKIIDLAESPSNSILNN